MEQKKDWTLSELYSKAWEIIKKNKVIWIFGIALTAASYSFGGNFNLPANTGGGNYQELFKSLPGNNPAKTPNVLGLTTGNPFDPIIQLFLGVPHFLYAILVLEFLLAIVGAIIIGLIYKAWSEASLIQSIQLGYENSEVSIRKSSEKAFPAIKSLIWLYVIPWLLFWIIFGLIFATLFGLIFIFKSNISLIILLGVLIFASFIFFIYVLLMLSLSLIWGVREAILNKNSAKNSLLIGYKIARKKFISMIVIGALNLGVTIAVIGIPIGIIVVLLISSVFLGININGGDLGDSLLKNLWIIIPAVLSFLIVFFVVIMFLTGIFTGFKAAVWNIAYNKIKGKYAN